MTKTYDLAGDDSFDEEFFEFGLFMSRREYKMIEKRLYRGRIQAQKEGYFIGSRPPYGYDKKRIGKGYVPVPNGSRAIYLQKVRAARDGILHDLNDMAIPTVTGTKWTAYAIREVIENQTYIGKIDTKTVRCEKSIKDGKVVPILTRVVGEMHTLEPKGQNDLLKMIVDRIGYEKTESGAAIEPTLRISLKI